jgi:hypothetical protein
MQVGRRSRVVLTPLAPRDRKIMSANDTTAVILHARGMTAVGGALFENRIVEMDCVATHNALILGGMTQIVRD